MRADDLSLTILKTLTISTTVGLNGIGVKDHYMYLLNTSATGTVVIEVYETSGVTQVTTKTITKTIKLLESTTGFEEILLSDPV